MADFDRASKTEEATPKRREEAARRGQVAVSPDLTGAIVLLATSLALRWVGPQLGTGLGELLSVVLPALPSGRWGIPEVLVWSRWGGTMLLQLTLGIVVGTAAISLLAASLQTGLKLAPEALAVRWERVNPTTGWGRLFSLEGVVRGVTTSLKVLLALGVGVGTVWLLRIELRSQARGTLLGSVEAAWDAGLTVVTALAFAAILFAVADYLFRRHRLEQELRMSRQELQDETREDQGDPQLRSQRRNRQREAVGRKSLRDVPEATMVVTNPTHLSVALQYREGQSGAPRVVAKGRGRLALRIRKIAAEHGVPVIERKPLARALYQLADVGQEIPVDLFHAVAEILAIVYRRKRAA